MMDVMLRVGGTSFRCECGANVFRHDAGKAKAYRCNGCGAQYEGESYDPYEVLRELVNLACYMNDFGGYPVMDPQEQANARLALDSLREKLCSECVGRLKKG